MSWGNMVFSQHSTRFVVVDGFGFCREARAQRAIIGPMAGPIAGPVKLVNPPYKTLVVPSGPD